MLVNLHVKNFAIIDEADVDFSEGLNILTGETGAGKSILIGSLGIALGGRVSLDVIGRDDESALVEAIFTTDSQHISELLREYDIEAEDGEIVISRKLTKDRTINRINGVSVPASVIKTIASELIDIHGQHEHQSLLRSDKHREIVDRFGGEKTANALGEVSAAYAEYAKLKKEAQEDDLDEKELERELDRLHYIRDEINAASLKEDEMQTIDSEYQRAANSGKLVEILSGVYGDGSKLAAESVGRVVSDLKKASEIDESITGFADQLIEIEGLLSDFNRDISSFMQDYSFDEAELTQLERRMDLIHSLQSKYGESYDDIMSFLAETEEKIVKYEDYENYATQRKERMQEAESNLKNACEKLSNARKDAAKELKVRICEALSDLNFANAEFDIELRELSDYTSKGLDEVEFIISTNPGEPMRSLAKVASGGELSRIMLAIKSVFAESDDIDTLIFDEIDTGISGRTAQAVSEKMAAIGRSHQIICITHLAQIAAMADKHFVIEKNVSEERSATVIKPLAETESVEELARILGGAAITDAVRENAREMKQMANELKK